MTRLLLLLVLYFIFIIPNQPHKPIRSLGKLVLVVEIRRRNFAHVLASLIVLVAVHSRLIPWEPLDVEFPVTSRRAE